MEIEPIAQYAKELQILVRRFEERVPHLTEDALKVEIRIFVEAIQQANTDHILRKIYSIQSKWAMADDSNDTLKSAAMVADVITKAIKTPPGNRRELLEMVAAYDRANIYHDD